MPSSFYRSLQIDKIKALKENKGNFQFTDGVELRRWFNNISEIQSSLYQVGIPHFPYTKMPQKKGGEQCAMQTKQMVNGLNMSLTVTLMSLKH